MTWFQNLLVGVDLSQSDPPGSNQFSPAVEEAIRTAIGLAEKTQAALTFFAAVDVPLDTPYLHLLADHPHNVACLLIDSAQDVLRHLVRDAQARGISATAEVAHGKGWIEIIRHVLHRRHDLVIAGKRNLHGIERFLLGSTTRRLLRKCPGPVWVARPDRATSVSNILVASDLHPVSAKALQAAATLRSVTGAKLHLVHAIDYPLDRILVSTIDARTENYHRRVDDDARQALAEQVTQLGAAGAGIEIEVVDGTRGADLAIVRYIEAHQIDLLVMGTVGRSGLAGVLVGNTAERLVHEAPCSILAVKPDDFHCPLTLAPPS